MILNLKKIRCFFYKSIKSVGKSIKYPDHFCKSKIETRKLDTTFAIKAIRRKFIINWTISKKDQIDEINLKIEAQIRIMKIK